MSKDKKKKASNKFTTKQHKKAYKQGVQDSLRVLYTHITSMEHSAGFAASKKADDYVDIMKNIYDTMATLYNQ